MRTHHPDHSDSTKKKVSELDLKQYQIRRPARLCIFIIFVVQFVVRMCTTFLDPSFTYVSKLLMRISLAFTILIPLIIAVEYLLYKKRGPGVVRYAKIVDIVILLMFMADWTLIIVSGLYRIQNRNPPSFKISALYGFTSFSWRTLMVILIASKWQIKILAPIFATGLVTGYTIYYNPSNWVFAVIKAVSQLFNIVLIIYCIDKINWKLMWTNFQHEKWVEVNRFILNNIPENIMILDFTGQTKFISDYCKDFMEKCQISPDNKDLFKKIRELQEQLDPDPFSRSGFHMERLTTCNGLFVDSDESDSRSIYKLEALEDLVMNFTNIIKRKNLQERQFLVYNAKLKIEEINNSTSEKAIEIKISFIHNFDHDYIVLILRDMTQRDLVVKLEETNKYKDQLLASVSHELRAPLNGNINLVEGAINSPKIPEFIKENLLIPALQSSKFLLHIINDILDMSQIKEKKLRLVCESGDLKETMKSTTELVEFQAKKKGIELVIELDPKLPKLFYTDHMRLSQIVLNLLSNAIKFTREGVVKLKVTTMFEQARWIKIIVEDSGIGINQEKLSRLVSKNDLTESKGDQTTKEFIGVGLGLNIASHLIELLSPKGHQNLIINSIPNEGSTFSFVLEDKESILFDIQGSKDQDGGSEDSDEVAEELANVVHPSRVQTFASANSLPLVARKSESETTFSSCSCSKVLIVDDNPFNIMALETILNSLEIKSDSVYSGSAALKKLLESSANTCGQKDCKQYSVIFMDQEMPEMNGADTVREIRSLQKEGIVSSGIRIIGCTAHKAKEEVDRFFEAGLDSCIFKPVSIVMVRDILKGGV